MVVNPLVWGRPRRWYKGDMVVNPLVWGRPRRWYKGGYGGKSVDIVNSVYYD
jgi:hypothetical protein